MSVVYPILAADEILVVDTPRMVEEDIPRLMVKNSSCKKLFFRRPFYGERDVVAS
jgi:hypothetical protein